MLGAGGRSVGGPTELAGVTAVPGVDLKAAQRERWGPDGISLPSHCPRDLSHLSLTRRAFVACFACHVDSPLQFCEGNKIIRIIRKKDVAVIATSCASLILAIWPALFFFF